MNKLKDSILIYGHDRLLLKTRRWILEGGGYTVVTAVDRTEFIGVPPQPPVNLIILCHSLDADDSVEAANEAAIRWPQIKTLKLTQHFLEPPPNTEGVPSISLDGPKVLIETVRKVILSPTSTVSSHTY